MNRKKQENKSEDFSNGIQEEGIVKGEYKEKNMAKKVDYDQFLSAAGEFGRYQVFFCIGVFPFYYFGGFTYFSQMFMTAVSPNHWCWIPELANLTIMERRSLAIPNDTDARFGYSQCTSYVANWSNVLSAGNRPDSTWKTDVCQYGWEFNKTEIPYPTISSEMGWVCDKSSYQATAQSFFFIGSLAGGLFFGWVSDRYGRIPTIVYCHIFAFAGGVASVFATNFIQFTASRFIMGLSYDTCFAMLFILLVEYVAPKYRALVSYVPMGLYYTLGIVTLPWISLACGHWKTISLVTSVPIALAVLTPLVFPESPRWLLSRGRVDDAIDKVLGIARVNKKEIPSKLIEEFRANAKEELEEKGSIVEFLKRPTLRTMFICACLTYTSNMIVFDAMVRTLGDLNFNFFLSFSIVSVTEFPALMVNAVIIDKTGRKWMNLAALIISGTLCILTLVVESGWPTLLFTVLARFAVNMSATACMQWGLEVLPTSVRGTGSSIIHTFGYIGTIISPFIAYLSVFMVWLPMVIIGAVAYFGAIVSLKLPETAGKELPQTFDDAERLVKESKILEFPCRKKKVPNEGHTNQAIDLNDI